MQNLTAFLRILPAILLLASWARAATAVDSIHVEGLFTDMAVLQIDGNRRVLKKGRTSPEGVTLISADSREAVLEWDGHQTRHGLGSHISGSYAQSERQTDQVLLWPDDNGMYRTIGSINGFTVRFLVDTGATLVAMNAQQAKRLGLDFRVDGEQGISSTASGFVRSYRVILDRVKVGDIELRDVEAGVIDGEHPGDILLGMSFLGRLEMQRSDRKLVLSTRPY